MVSASSHPSSIPTVLSVAQIAGEITKRKWEDINLSSEGNPRLEPESVVALSERILAVLLVRIIAILYDRRSEEDWVILPEFPDLSTSSICHIINSHPEKETLRWPSLLTEEVIHQLTKYVNTILEMYRVVSYHSREHAYHVFMSANKLLDLVLCEYDWSFQFSVTPIKKPERSTFGIKSDPLLQLAFLFSALVHDVDHTGVSNRQLVLESDELAIMYNDQSCAEQRSLAIAFSLLMKKDYEALKGVLFQDDKEYKTFRKSVIDLVLCTDIASPERVQIVKSKWKEAFGDKSKKKVAMAIFYDEDEEKEDPEMTEDDIDEAINALSTVGSIDGIANDSTVGGSSRRSSMRRPCLKHNTAAPQTSIKIPTPNKAGEKKTFRESADLGKSLDSFMSEKQDSFCREPTKLRLRRLFLRSRRSMPLRKSLGKLMRKSSKKGSSSSRKGKKERKAKRIGKDQSEDDNNGYLSDNSDLAQGDSDIEVPEHPEQIVDVSIPAQMSSISHSEVPQGEITNYYGAMTKELSRISAITTTTNDESSRSLLKATSKKKIEQLKGYLKNYDDDLSYDSERSSRTSVTPGTSKNAEKEGGSKKVLRRKVKSFGDDRDKMSEEIEEKVTRSCYQKRLEEKNRRRRKSTDCPRTNKSINESHHSRTSSLERRHSTQTITRRYTEPPESSIFNRKKFQFRLGIRRALDLSGNQISLYEPGSNKNRMDDPDQPDELKSIVVLEHLLKAADVAANMQSWDTMVLWCKRLFREQKNCFVEGRGPNPEIGWHENQIAFFESYTMPLACHLVETGIFEFDVASGFVNGVRQNNIRWMIDGTKVIENMVKEWEEIQAREKSKPAAEDQKT